MSDCCDDPADACHDDYVDWDDDLGPVKEEPDCFRCNDMGCAECSHPAHCDCAECFDHAVWEYEVFDHPDLAYVGPFVDEPPF